MKKMVAAAAVPALLSAVLAGCSSGSMSSSGSTSAGTASAAPVTITFQNQFSDSESAEITKLVA